jgi:hypothetical protein
MSGPVTYGVWPFASTVTVGDNTGGGGTGGATPVISPGAATFAQTANDDLDDGTPAGKARAEAYVKEQIANGTFKQSDVDKGNNVVPREIDNRPPPNITGTTVDCTAIHQGFNLGTKITPTTTLKQFIYDYPAIPNHKYSSVPAQMGLTPDQIVCNLAHLCLNVWEPVKAKYPNVIMTNSLRTGSAVGAGPHGTGQGMDIQFVTSKGISIAPADYFAIASWMKENIAYDQIILEYSTQRGYTVAWIHCGIYAGTGKKVSATNKVLTMMNHQVRAVGLANLAN